MTVALTSLFDQKVRQRYNREIDKALASSDVLGTTRGLNGHSAKGGSGLGPFRSKQAAATHSMRELSKLNQLLVGG
jgi:hypothetical protein